MLASVMQVNSRERVMLELVRVLHVVYVPVRY